MTGEEMKKQSAKQTSSFYEEDDDLFDAVEESLQEVDEEEVPEDDYIPDVPPPKPLTKQGRALIVREVRPDPQTVVRKRVVLTRSMCRRKGCNYDAVVDLGTKAHPETGKPVPLFTEYKRVPLNRREEVKQLLEQHIAIVHSANNEHIVFESDLQTEWFGVDVYTGQPRSARG